MTPETLSGPFSKITIGSSTATVPNDPHEQRVHREKNRLAIEKAHRDKMKKEKKKEAMEKLKARVFLEKHNLNNPAPHKRHNPRHSTGAG
jgi:hypothetical protein